MKWTERIIWLLAVLLLIYLLSTCRSCRSTPAEPDITPVERIRDTIRVNEANYDSAVAPYLKIIQHEQVRGVKLESDYLDEQDRSLQLQQDNDSLLSLLQAGDLTSNIKDQAGKISSSQRRKDSLCNARVSALISQRSAQQAVMAEKDMLYKELKRQADTCLKNQAALQKYQQGIRPRNKVAIGPVANVYPVFGIGAGVDFIHKKGYVFSGSAMAMNRELFIQVGVKKVISFR